jgi:3-isopropylmalate/(R)-2-methylmalate dehydratase small subunit
VDAGLTMAQKILHSHGVEDVEPGSFGRAFVDLVLVNEVSGSVAMQQFSKMGAERVFDPSKIALVADHFVPAKDARSAELVAALRRFAREQGINTDNILSGPYLNLTDPDELGKHLLETYDADIAARVRPGDVLVGGVNFGMGSSREQAQVALRARGVPAIVAAGFARIFLRNCINIGLPAVESPEAASALRDLETVRIDLGSGVIEAESGRWTVPKQPQFLADLMDGGGLVPWVRRRLEES